MDDLISRQDAIDAISCDITVTGRQNAELVAATIGAFADRIKALPSAEPEIIRCKDCENWIPGYITDNDDFIPPKCGKYQQMVGHSSDDYCSHAERKTDG